MQLLALKETNKMKYKTMFMTARVLKNRYSGLAGACSLSYNKETGRLTEGNFLMNEKLLTKFILQY